jgi:hypothetical protein
MNALVDDSVVAVYEKWHRVRPGVAWLAQGGASFNGVPLALLRAVDDFRKASGCGRLLSCTFEQNPGEDVASFSLQLELKRGVALVDYRADGDRSFCMDAALRGALGRSRAERVRALYRSWVACGLPGERRSLSAREQQ